MRRIVSEWWRWRVYNLTINGWSSNQKYFSFVLCSFDILIFGPLFTLFLCKHQKFHVLLLQFLLPDINFLHHVLFIHNKLFLNHRICYASEAQLSTAWRFNQWSLRTRVQTNEIFEPRHMTSSTINVSWSYEEGI